MIATLPKKLHNNLLPFRTPLIFKASELPNEIKNPSPKSSH